MPTDSVESAKAWYSQNIGVRSRTDSKPVISIVEEESMYPPPIDAAFPMLPSSFAGDEDFQAARTRREIAEANLAEMREAELEGKLIRVDVIRAAWARRVSSTRDALLQLPSRLAPTLAAESDVNAVALLMEENLRQALSNLTANAAATGAENGSV
jgi:hypothetical protein